MEAAKKNLISRIRFLYLWATMAWKEIPINCIRPPGRNKDWQMSMYPCCFMPRGLLFRNCGRKWFQIDVLPTIAGLLPQPYTNTTLGRDLLDENKKRMRLSSFTMRRAGSAW